MITDMDLMWLLEDYGKAVDDHRHGPDVVSYICCPLILCIL